MVFGDAEHQEIFGEVPVRFAKLPKRAADGIQTTRRHVNRAKATVGGKVGRAVVGGPPARQGLRLIATCKECQFRGVFFTHVAQPFGGDVQGFVALDLFELAFTALTHAKQGLFKAGRGIVVHDARRAFTAQNTLVYGVVGVALDVAHFTIFQVNFNAATAGAHIACGRFNLV